MFVDRLLVKVALKRGFSLVLELLLAIPEVKIVSVADNLKIYFLIYLLNTKRMSSA